MGWNKTKKILQFLLRMTVLAIPSFFTLVSTVFLNKISTDSSFVTSTIASSILGIFVTATASGLFYVLIKRAVSVFASLVTNSMPIVAVFWGLLSGESITIIQIICLAVILGGIYYANRKVAV